MCYSSKNLFISKNQINQRTYKRAEIGVVLEMSLVTKINLHCNTGSLDTGPLAASGFEITASKMFRPVSKCLFIKINIFIIYQIQACHCVDMSRWGNMTLLFILTLMSSGTKPKFLFRRASGTTLQSNISPFRLVLGFKFQNVKI